MRMEKVLKVPYTNCPFSRLCQCIHQTESFSIAAKCVLCILATIASKAVWGRSQGQQLNCHTVCSHIPCCVKISLETVVVSWLLA